MATTTSELVQELIAGSATFQTEAGAATAAAALERVYRVAKVGRDEAGVDHDLGHQRPYALVEDISRNYRQTHGGFPSGATMTMFEFDVIEEQKFEHEKPMVAFEKTMQDIIADMMALGRTGGYLLVRAIDSVETPQREHAANTTDPHISQRWVITWGLS